MGDSLFRRHSDFSAFAEGTQMPINHVAHEAPKRLLLDKLLVDLCDHPS
jgi:hypothetical protein